MVVSNQNNFIIDFSKDKPTLPTAVAPWQKEIIEFIKLYSNQNEIPVHTSGSTGTPKAYFLKRSAMRQSARLTADFLSLFAGDTSLLCLPMNYIAGKMMVVRAIEIGMKLICVEPKSILNIEYNDPIDFAAFTPMQAESSFHLFDSKIHIKKIILGGAKVSKTLENKFLKINSEVYETYGMTETITHIAMRKLNNQSYFHTLKDVEIGLNNDSCLMINTPYLDEWIETNDVAEIMSANTFQILGRVDNIINSGGLKVNPEELEEKLKPYIEHPFIIHYRQDAQLGQKIVLVIESGKAVEVKFPTDLIEKNKQPKEIYFLSKFPRTESGKILRRKIKL